MRTERAAYENEGISPKKTKGALCAWAILECFEHIGASRERQSAKFSVS